MRLVDFSRDQTKRNESPARNASRKTAWPRWGRPDLSGIPAETREMTFLVCRMRGFQELTAELTNEPETLARIARLTMSPMVDVVLARGGTVARLGPGELTAFFNAPLDDAQHATRACGAAIAMLQELEKANRLVEQAKRRDGGPLSPVDLGIGLFTGEAMVGDFGAAALPAYTAIGRAFSLASEIEKISAVYGASILAGSATRAQAEKNLAFLEIDHVAIDEGEPLRLYAVLGTKLSRSNPSFMALNAFHDRIFECFRAREWEHARALIAQARTLSGANPMLYDLYARRLAYLERNPPGSEWSGVLSVSAPDFAAA